MVEKIYEIKNAVLDRIQNDIRESGIERIDVTEIGKMVDMVKDLAEAEEKCWESEYYHKVSDSMGSPSKNYSSQSRGYNMNNYDSRHMYQMPGYQSGHMGSENMAETVKMAMQGMTPAEREHLREQLRVVME